MFLSFSKATGYSGDTGVRGPKTIMAQIPDTTPDLGVPF